MKILVKLALIATFLQWPFQIFAQKDSIRLICPLNEAVVVPPPKNAIKYDQEDLCIVLQSIPDSVVKSAGTGRVTNTEFTEESKNGVVLYLKLKGKDYYIWYTGLDKLLVRRNDVVKTGQPLGYVSNGGKIELIMYEFETPVDPIRFFDCKGVLKSEK
jgi:Peptidase family M23